MAGLSEGLYCTQEETRRWISGQETPTSRIIPDNLLGSGNTLVITSHIKTPKLYTSIFGVCGGGGVGEVGGCGNASGAV